MKKKILIFLALICLYFTSNAQLLSTENGAQHPSPLDGIIAKKQGPPPPVLKYETFSENEILWKKIVWRVIDTKELMNKPFVYEGERFSEILFDGAATGEITAYRGDDFKERLTQEEVENILFKNDTIWVVDPVTQVETMKIVKNDMNHAEITRYRIKEVWYIDNQTSRLNVRILGIAPLKDKYDDNGNFRYELPLLWIHYPNTRSFLAQYKVFNSWNDHQVLSWEDHLEMRFFASYIYKENNVYDRRLKEYLTEVDLLLEGQKIQDGIFNFEQDLWSR